VVYDVAGFGLGFGIEFEGERFDKRARVRKLSPGEACAANLSVEVVEVVAAVVAGRNGSVVERAVGSIASSAPVGAPHSAAMVGRKASDRRRGRSHGTDNSHVAAAAAADVVVVVDADDAAAGAVAVACAGIRDVVPDSGYEFGVVAVAVAVVRRAESRRQQAQRRRCSGTAAVNAAEAETAGAVVVVAVA
jgi:hypothetical protein